MSSPAPEPQELLALLRSRTAPVEIRLFAARCLLPLDPADQLRALLSVLSDEDPDIRAMAQGTFRRLPPEDVVRFVDASHPGEVELHAIASLSEDPLVLERLVRSRNVADETLEMLARTVTGPAQEAFVVNQVRLLRRPALIEALFENPELTDDSRRRLNEVREEFFDKEKRRREADAIRLEVEEAIREAEEAEKLAAEAGGGTPTGEAAAALEELDPSIMTSAIFRRISVMTVSEKIGLAYSGGKEERRILIGDSNKLVGLAVLKSRGLTGNEVETFCTMRHLDIEIFRKIALNREWIRQPAVATALVKNPKVPLAISLPLVKNLPVRELKVVARDPNLPEGVRINARKLLTEKRR